MEKPNAWILNLYEGANDSRPDDVERADEAASMREMKALLDARPRKKPDADVVSSVLAAARGEAVPVGLRRDRSPARRSRTVGLRVGAVSAVVVALLALVGLLEPGILVNDEMALQDEMAQQDASRGDFARPPVDPTAPEDDAIAFAPDGTDSTTPSAARPAGPSAGTSPEPEAEHVREGGIRAGGTEAPDVEPSHAEALHGEALAAVLDAARSRRTGGGVPADEAGESVGTLAWDEREDVIDLHQRIEMIGSGVEQGWETPAVPLEMIPTGRGDGILPAGQRR